MAKDEFDWLAPVLGFVGLLAGTLFFTGNTNASTTNNTLPPPPQNPQHSGGCGCQHKKT